MDKNKPVLEDIHFHASFIIAVVAAVLTMIIPAFLSLGVPHVGSETSSGLIGFLTMQLVLFIFFSVIAISGGFFPYYIWAIFAKKYALRHPLWYVSGASLTALSWLLMNPLGLFTFQLYTDEKILTYWQQIHNLAPKFLMSGAAAGLAAFIYLRLIERKEKQQRNSTIEPQETS